MKHFNLFFLTCFILCQTVSINTKTIEKKVSVHGSKQWGFFAEFLWVLNHLEYCKRNNLIPIVYWDSKSAYYSPQGYNGSFNAWEYYFEPVSSKPFLPKYPIKRQLTYSKKFTTIWDYTDYIDKISLLPLAEQQSFIKIPTNEYTKVLKKDDKTGYPVPFGNKHLYDQSFRRYVKEEILDPFIRVKPSVAQKIENFWTTNMKGKKTIGIHLRGNFLGNEVRRVPDEIILAAANKYASQGYQFLVATDQIPLAEKAINTLQATVIMYNCERAMSTTSPYLSQQLTPQHGEDVLIEALLLSRCDHFIHTLSQVATAVLYFNPYLSHTVFYS